MTLAEFKVRLRLALFCVRRRVLSPRTPSALSFRTESDRRVGGDGGFFDFLRWRFLAALRPGLRSPFVYLIPEACASRRRRRIELDEVLQGRTDGRKGGSHANVARGGGGG